MTLLERKVDAIARALLAGSMAGHNEALDELRELLGKTQESYQDVEDAARAALLELGVPDRLLGHSRLVLAIRFVVEEPGLVNALAKELYPKIADAQGCTASQVERAIRHAIEVGWERLDMETMQAYFGSTVSPIKDKPTNGEYISRVANVIRQRMKGAV